MVTGNNEITVHKGYLICHTSGKGYHWLHGKFFGSIADTKSDIDNKIGELWRLRTMRRERLFA